MGSTFDRLHTVADTGGWCKIRHDLLAQPEGRRALTQEAVLNDDEQKSAHSAGVQRSDAEKGSGSLESQPHGIPKDLNSRRTSALWQGTCMIRFGTIAIGQLLCSLSSAFEERPFVRGTGLGSS